jgi:hypothetical protein
MGEIENIDLSAPFNQIEQFFLLPYSALARFFPFKVKMDEIRGVV